MPSIEKESLKVSNFIFIDAAIIILNDAELELFNSLKWNVDDYVSEDNKIFFDLYQADDISYYLDENIQNFIDKIRDLTREYDGYFIIKHDNKYLSNEDALLFTR